MEEKQFHNQVYWITFLFSLLVVWVHSFNAELYLCLLYTSFLQFQFFLAEFARLFYLDADVDAEG